MRLPTMRILQVIPLYDSYRVFLRYLASALMAQGNEFLTVCDCLQRLLPFPIDHALPLRHLDFPRGANPLQQWRAARRLRAVIREFQPYVVHAHFSSAILVAALARFGHKKSASGAGLRWFGTFQGLQFPLATGWKRGLFKFAEALGSKGMDLTWVLTDDAADALLFPTSREGMPVGVMETLARRRPVLTNRVRGCAELIQPGVNGQFFESATKESIAEVLRQFSAIPCPPPNPLTRRSAWIEESVHAYARAIGH